MKYLLAAAAISLASPGFAQDVTAAAEAFVRSPVQQKLIDDMLSPEVLMAQMQGMAQQLPPEQLEKLVAIITDELNTVRPAMETAMIEGASQAFSIEEIEAMTEFYNSPLGASAMGKMTPYMQQTMGALGPELQQMQQNIIQRVQAELQ